MWDPRAILGIYPEENGFHCVGTTLKGARCRNSFISRQYLAEAVTILDSLPKPRHSRSNNDGLLSTLQRLAYLTLCPRWHQQPGRNCQIDTVASRWLGMILDTVDQRHPRPIRSDSYPTSSYLPSPPPTPLSNSSPPRVARRSAALSPESLDRVHGRRQPSPSPALPSSPLGSQPSIITRALQSHASSWGHNTPTPSSSHRTANSPTQHSQSEGPINININVTIVGNQPELHHSRFSSASTSSRTNHRRTPPASPPSFTPSRTPSIDTHISATINDRPITSTAIEAILERLEAIETLLRQNPPRTSSRSSRSSSGFFSSGPNTPGSPALSPISNLSIPPLLEPASFFFPLVRSPAPSPPSGPLSISSESSSRQIITTPTSSGMLSPVLLSPRSASPPESVRSNGSISSSRRIRRRPITADTTCYVCYQSIASTDDAVWCRGRCGQNVCIGCFEEWTSSQLDSDREVSCGFCRAPWVF